MSISNVIRYVTVKLEIAVPDELDVDADVMPELDYEFSFDNADSRCHIAGTEIVEVRESFYENG